MTRSNTSVKVGALPLQFLFGGATELPYHRPPTTSPPKLWHILLSFLLKILKFLLLCSYNGLDA